MLHIEYLFEEKNLVNFFPVITKTFGPITSLYFLGVSNKAAINVLEKFR